MSGDGKPELKKIVRCYIYARVSTDEHAKRDLSIPFQLERCRYHAKARVGRSLKSLSTPERAPEPINAPSSRR